MKKICKACGKLSYIVNKTKVLCDECNFKRLHKGKTRYQVALEKQKLKPKKIRKNTGELALFKEIWNERPHICTHCGKMLLGELKPIYFSHIKSKGAHPELRLCKSNIELVCADCHQEYEFGRRNK